MRLPTFLSLELFREATHMYPALSIHNPANNAWPCTMIAAAIYDDARGNLFHGLNEDFDSAYRAVCEYVKTNYEPAINGPVVCAPRVK